MGRRCGEANSRISQSREDTGKAHSESAIWLPSSPGVGSGPEGGRATPAFLLPLSARCTHTAPCPGLWASGRREPGAGGEEVSGPVRRQRSAQGFRGGRGPQRSLRSTLLRAGFRLIFFFFLLVSLKTEFFMNIYVYVCGFFLASLKNYTWFSVFGFHTNFLIGSFISPAGWV